MKRLLIFLLIITLSTVAYAKGGGGGGGGHSSGGGGHSSGWSSSSSSTSSSSSVSKGWGTSNSMASTKPSLPSSSFAKSYDAKITKQNSTSSFNSYQASKNPTPTTNSYRGYSGSYYSYHPVYVTPPPTYHYPQYVYHYGSSSSDMLFWYLLLNDHHQTAQNVFYNYGDPVQQKAWDNMRQEAKTNPEVAAHVAAIDKEIAEIAEIKAHEAIKEHDLLKTQESRVSNLAIFLSVLGVMCVIGLFIFLIFMWEY
jgi:hypothetical protein